MKLYEISEVYTALLASIEAGEIPEEAIADTLEAVGGEFEEKADNVACMVKSLRADAKAIKAEEEALSDRRKSAESRADALANYLSVQMTRIGISKVETPRSQITFRKSTALEIADEESFKAQRPDLCETVVTVKIPKADITKLIKGGEEIAGVQLVERQNIQIK